jgi:hypothetical protein
VEILPDTRFALYPIEHVARGKSRAGWEEFDFNTSLLPFQIMDRVYIEDISSRFRDDEFDPHDHGMGPWAVKELKRMKYAIIHRYPQIEMDPVTDAIVHLDVAQMKRAERLVREIAVCLRLIRPTLQRAQFCEGQIRDDGTFFHGRLDVPNPMADVPLNQRLFSVRDEDVADL